MAIKTSDLVDHINSLEAKLNVLAKQVAVLEEKIGNNNLEAMKPKGLGDKIRALFSRS